MGQIYGNSSFLWPPALVRVRGGVRARLRDRVGLGMRG